MVPGILKSSDRFGSLTPERESRRLCFPSKAVDVDRCPGWWGKGGGGAAHLRVLLMLCDPGYVAMALGT